MKKNFKNKPWFLILKNKYVWILLLFTIWMLFLDNYSYMGHRVLNKQIDELEQNKEYYQQEIKKDVQNINKLKKPAEIEKYGREEYHMKKENEDVYIIEFEGDSIEQNIKK